MMSDAKAAGASVRSACRFLFIISEIHCSTSEFLRQKCSEVLTKVLAKMKKIDLIRIIRTKINHTLD